MSARSHEIKLIHIGKTALNMDDDAYRDLLHKLTGQRSAASLSDPQRRKVIEHFKRCGFEVKPKDNRHVSKLRALWHQIADIGVVKDRSFTAFNAWCMRQNPDMGKLSDITAAQAAPLIEALKRWHARELARQMVEKAKQA